MTSEKPGKLRAAILVALMVLAAALLLVAVFLMRQNVYHVNPLEHWTVSFKDGAFEDVALSDARFGRVGQDDVITLRNVLPEETVHGACLQIQTVHASIRVFVGDEEVYEDGRQYPPQKLMTPTRFYFVPLHAGYEGQPLRIELRAAETGAFSGLNPIYFGSVHDVYLSYLHQMRLTILISLFLVVTGGVMLFIFFFLWNYYQREARIFYSALIALVLGVYLLNYNELPDFVTSRVGFNDFFEYATLYAMPLLFISFLNSIQENGKNDIYTALVWFDAGLLLYLFVLHFTRTVAINRFVPLSHLLIFAEGVTLMVVMAGTRFRSRKTAREGTGREAWKISEKVLLQCFFVLLLFAMIDIVRYAFIRYFGATGSTYVSLDFLMIGALIFVVGLFLNFFYYHIERVNDSETVKRLSGLAYTDPLTGMANRSRCEKIISEMDEASSPCSVVSMDVDHLKRINDAYGHATGDQYLVDMAAILRRCFPEARLLGRMGGDEFIVVLDGVSREGMSACTRDLDAAVDKANETSEKIHYGISYGCAYTDEEDTGTIQAALEKADARMYEMKKIRHAKEAAA